MRCGTGTLIFVLTLLIPAQVLSASSSRAREKAAKVACAAGDFRKGVEILAELYVDTDNATHLFNQGRCYEQNHQWVSAIDRFREYLRKSTKATAEERAEAERHIADCETFRAQEEAKLAPPAPPPTPIAAPVAVEPPAPEPAPAVATTSPEPASEHRGSGLRVTGIVLGSLGLAAVATGVVLNLRANSLGTEYNKTHDPSTKSSHSSFKTGSMIGYGAGAGLVATGLVLYLVGRSAGSSETSSKVAITPVLAPSQLSIALTTVF